MHFRRISLETLYAHALADTEGASIRGDSPKGREYGRNARLLTDSILESPGFYLWGKYENNNLWRTIYLGKAGYGRPGSKKKTSLQARIEEELKDERAFLWNGHPPKLSRDDLMKIGRKYYPRMWYRYEAHFERAIRKSGTTRIIWAVPSGIKNNEVPRIEADLIETMNPIANIQRPRPESDLQDKTIEVIRMFKSQIHAGRDEADNL